VALIAQEADPTPEDDVEVIRIFDEEEHDEVDLIEE
jgi:hypothetical protein